jgi:hypothetical protein
MLLVEDDENYRPPGDARHGHFRQGLHFANRNQDRKFGAISLMKAEPMLALPEFPFPARAARAARLA